MSDSERDKLIESICRLKAERDQLRKKEEKWTQERDRVKKVTMIEHSSNNSKLGDERDGRQRNGEKSRDKTKV